MKEPMKARLPEDARYQCPVCGVPIETVESRPEWDGLRLVDCDHRVRLTWTTDETWHMEPV